MNKLITFFAVFLLNCTTSKNETTFINNCFSEEKANLINEMVTSFENRICKYYKVEKKNTHRAYLSYLKDISTMSLNIKNITSQKELELLDRSNSELRNILWVPNKEKQNTPNDNSDDAVILITPQQDDEEQQRIQKEQDRFDKFLSIDYSGEYAKCLIKNSNGKDFKDVIKTLKEIPDISPNLIAGGLLNLNKEDLESKTVQTFISLELYYALLNMLKNE